LYVPRSARLTGGDYMGSVLTSFLSVASAQLRVCVERLTPHTSLSPIPGGVLLGSPESRVGAVVFASGVSDGLLADLVAGDAIVMTLDSVSNVEGVDCVAVDCQWEAESAVEYLAGQGHRTIAFLAVGWLTERERWAGGLDPDGQRFEHAMRAAKQRLGLNQSPDHHIEYVADVAGTDTPERAVVDRLLRLKPRPTAAICFASTTARKVVDALRHRGLRCPRDISVFTRGAVGSDPGAFTHLQSDPIQIGRTAAEHLLNRFAYNSAGPTRLLIRSRLVEGSTVAPV
jgi:DNA-binding LacI/PurR family transcriptional regulator